ncbi:Predicted thiol-disulfide oxidoreductase YuxK, DCC family [Paenibacillus sp. 1_12]|uniref:thiol-disulfide oxidoreductase DCC family protein n=1 Tax=Paenibacillus sp. 1_12 TaxID=1566278 RepID=UPI0008E32C2A|nr:thiol-disulfide oxidoreductase DCC family protein [Paenibacillus sp. 1_12]SFL87554.1 Predicted thiol-disulfide oxidoreductase YuxK, DCC family [Paenibacillus sp. 1_12]
MTAKIDLKPEQSLETHSIVLFDGVCRFCNGWVQFILRHDKHDKFRFAPLQSDYAIQLLASGQLKDASLDSVVLCEGSSVYTHSAAVLQICNRLGGAWRVLTVFKVVPRPIRDTFYRFIAKRRYRWFGKYDSCMIPNAEIRSKFIG